MVELRKFIMVSFDCPENAKKALDSVQAEFFGSTFSSRNFNRVEGTRVYVEKEQSFVTDEYIMEVLLSKEGALPANCHMN